jgi:HD-like signal output (HDOD) protein
MRATDEPAAAVVTAAGTGAPTPTDLAAAAPRTADWWESPPAATPPTTLLEGLDGGAIQTQLEASLAGGTFKMVEIPANVFRCLEILNQPDFDYGEVELLISHSPVLAGNIITIANSSIYSRGSAISKLSVALPRLGCGKIKAILYFASCERQLSNHPLFSQVAPQITRHSYPDSDSAFLAGLLHDVGKLAILKEMASHYSFGHQPAKRPALTEESCGDILPLFHAQVGGLIAANWKLAPTITNVIAHHHDLAVDIADADDQQLDMCLVRIVHLSDIVARMLGFGIGVGPVHLPSLCETLISEIVWDEDTASFFRAVPQILEARQTL